MPAGDLITADWQIELRAALMGAGTSFLFPRPGGIKGLGVPPVKTNDVELDLADGSYAGRDFHGPRLITVSFFTKETSASLALDRLESLNGIWAPSTTDLELHFRLPGWRFKVSGRPRGLDDDIDAALFGHVKAMATFFCPTPTITLV